jgi:hypothetical protein
MMYTDRRRKSLAQVAKLVKGRIRWSSGRVSIRVTHRVGVPIAHRVSIRVAHRVGVPIAHWVSIWIAHRVSAPDAHRVSI